ncbi:MAG TPA: DUF2905 domain-containing protein [Actinobacteria bacterium]|nr:DUF2905 domain-containing protein [Actinomycetota bacterium]
MSLEALGRALIGFAAVLVVVGGLLIFLGKIGFLKLPGDILLRRGNTSVFWPIGTSIVVSIILTILINVVIWWWRR